MAGRFLPTVLGDLLVTYPLLVLPFARHLQRANRRPVFPHLALCRRESRSLLLKRSPSSSCDQSSTERSRVKSAPGLGHK